MEYTTDNCKTALLNTEARTAVTNFISNLIDVNGLPVYIVKNLLLEAVYNLNVKESEEYAKASQVYRQSQESEVTQEDGNNS